MSEMIMKQKMMVAPKCQPGSYLWRKTALLNVCLVYWVVLKAVLVGTACV